MTSSAFDRIRWSTVLSREPASYVFAVTSTGIYCRTDCPSRRPRLENVRFFDTWAEAEQGGFRACLRCRPQDEHDTARAKIEQARQYIEAHSDGRITLADLSVCTGLSPFHLHRSFKAAMGLTPRQYAEACRMSLLKQGLHNGNSVTRASYDAGYGSSSRVYERSDAHLGMTPASYRKGGAGVQLQYTVAACSLGKLLIASTERGVSAIRLGDSETELEESLRKEFPAAILRRADKEMREWTQTVIDSLAGDARELNLPLDVRATVFQRLVWRHLQTIPRGKTQSYSEVASAIGKRGSARAVARACAANPVALAIPCHRVVREDGNISGYRWGVDRKRKLLAAERESQSSR